MVSSLTYKRIECNNDKSLDDQNSPRYHRKIKLYYLNFVFDILMIA